MRKYGWLLLWTGWVATVMGMAGTPSRVVFDRLHRRVEVPATGPRRVVTMVPSIAEMLVWLGVADRIVGVVRFTPDLPGLERVPRVGGPLNPSYETLAALNPDLVLLSRNHNPRELAETLDRMQIPYAVLIENTLADMQANLALLARIFQRENQYRMWVQKWQRVWACLHRQAWPRRPRVLLLLATRPIFTVGRGSFITEVLTASGLDVVSRDIPQPWPQVALEQIATWDPAWILIPEPNFTSLRRELRHSPAWQTLTAVRQDRIVPVPETIHRATPYLLNVMQYLIQTFHPDFAPARACFPPPPSAPKPGHRPPPVQDTAGLIKIQ